MPTCFACLRAHLPTWLPCLRALRSYVPCVVTCQRTLCASCAYVPRCSRAITTNNKNKFSVICFPYTFVIVISFFFLWNKTVVHSCVIVYKKTDKCYNEWQRGAQRVTTSGTTSDNELQWAVQQLTTNDNEWYNKWQRVTGSNTTTDTSDNKWQWVISLVQRMKTAQ